MAGINNIISTFDRLPALPGAVNRVVSMLSSGEYDMGELESVISTDEALTSAVLRIGNSAAYGTPGKTFALKQSLVRLGSATLMKLVLEQEMTQVFEVAGAGYGLRRHAMWRGSVGGAVVAEKIASDSKFTDPNLCFVCALLRDIGKLAIDAYLCGDNAPQADPDEDYLNQERSAFGFDHAEVGRLLAQNWNLPDRIADAIGFHHTPPAPDDQTHDVLFDIVHAADVVCLWSGMGIGCDGLNYRVAEHVKQAYLPHRKVAEEYMAFAWTRISEIEDDSQQTRGAIA